MSNNSISPVDTTRSGASTAGQNEPENDANEGTLHIPQSSKAGASQSDSLVSYPGYSLAGSYPLERFSRCILQPQPTIVD